MNFSGHCLIKNSISISAPTFVDHSLLPDVNFNVHCLIKNSIYISKKVMHLYVSYTLGPQLRNLNADFTLDNRSFECWSR